MEYTAENLEKAVTLFYRSEAGQQAQAHQWLTEAQSCPQAWSFVWELLQPHRSSEVQFFAATTLHTKILRYWFEVPPEQYEPLKKQLLDAILTYAMGPKIVLNRLCITLSAYILYTIPHYWPNAFAELLTSFQPQNLPNIQPERIIWVLLEILTLIPEEFQSMNFLLLQKNVVKNELQTASKDVLKAIEAYMSTIMSNTFSTADITTYLHAARCAHAWFQFGGITISNCDNIITYLLEICSNCYWKCSSSSSSSTAATITHDDDDDGLTSDETELIEATLEAVCTIVAHPLSQKYPMLVTIQLDRIMNKLVKILHAEREKNDFDMNVQVPIYSLIITCAETHSKILIDNLMKPPNSREYQLSLCIIHTILMCTDTKGAHPIDEECSNLTFGFWYLLQDEVIKPNTTLSENVVQTVKPIYKDLISVLLRKSMLPSNDDDPKWSTESKETLRCHRQDIADTMMYSYKILDDDLLNILQEKLHESIQLCNENTDCWPHIEACLYAYFAIAEHFESEEEVHLPRLMEILTKIPYDKLHVKVLSTALDIIGAYATWINEHPYVLNNVIPLLLLGLVNPEVGTSSTMALKDITRECQIHIHLFAVQILQTAQNVLHRRVLRVAENIRLMYSVGKVLSVLPLENIMEYLNLILMPIIEEFQTILDSHQLNNATRSLIIIKLRMIAMLFSTLHTNNHIANDDDTRTSTTTAEDVKKDTNNSQPQPTLIVLQKIMPLFNQLAHKSCEDVEIMEVLYSALKHAIIILLDESKPLVNDILQLLVNGYRTKPLCSALVVFKHLILMFGKDSEFSHTMHLLLCEIVNVTLQLTAASKNLSENADVLDTFFGLLTQFFKKCPELLYRDGIHILALFQCATVCLGVPELSTVKSAGNFLVKFILHSRECGEPLLSTVHQAGEALVIKVCACIGGESPRTGLDPFADILLALNKKYCDYLARWFAIIVAQDGFPSRLPTTAQKDQFVKSILREKTNKHKMKETIKEFSLICRGLVGTEYGTHNSYL